MLRPTVAVLAALVAAAPSPLAADAVDDYVTTHLAARKIPGAAVLVMRDGAIERAQGYGFADVEHGVAVTDETIFQSGSVGKMFTAAGILKLVDDGRLRLDDRLAQHLAGPAAWHRITIRHLLTHTSGLKDYGEEFDFRKDYSDDEFLDVMRKLPLEFEPGTQWSYSNSGYLILGQLTSKLAGEHWSDFQAKRVFAPLGMTTTRVISERDLVPHRAAGYELDAEGALKNQEWVAPPFNRCADGALYFSLRDLAAWERGLAAGSFLAPASFAAWWEPVSLAGGRSFPYGFGWSFAEQRGERVVEHGGAWQGFRAAVVRYPEQKLFVAVLANLAQAEPETMAHAIAGLVEPRLALRDPAATAVDPDPARTARLREALGAWSEFRVAPAMSPALAATASGSAREAGDRRRTGARLAKATAFRFLGEDVLTPAARRQIGGDVARAVEYALETPEARFAYRFLLDAHGRVVSFAAERR
ncbi:MAG: beta-lactamase family protein [Thermoanaerobaculia bacterium]|nr:beta-lactamase family protein [Thermoanaerobaculia bacterium]